MRIGEYEAKWRLTVDAMAALTYGAGDGSDHETGERVTVPIHRRTTIAIGFTIDALLGKGPAALPGGLRLS